MLKNSLFILALLFVVNSFAQKATIPTKDITLEDIWQNYTFYANSVPGFNFQKDGKHYTRLEKTKIQQYDLTTGAYTKTIFDAESVAGNDAFPGKFSDYTFSEDENNIVIETASEQIYRHSSKANFFIWNGKQLSTVFEDGKQMYVTFNPAADKVAFVHDNNLYFKNLTSNKVTQITTDGKFNEIINGALDWVYEEEFSFSRGFDWSPDGKKIAFYRFDESQVKEFNMNIYNGELYPEQVTFKYPKVGERNSTVTIHIYDTETGKITKAETGAEEDIYIPRIKWTKDPNKLVVFRMNRHQNELELLLTDATTGKTSTLLKETNKYYIDIHDNLTFLEDGKHFIWTSEMDGWNHIYLYNMNGTLENQITKGNWEVTNFYGLDEKNGLIYYQAAENSPLERQVYSISLKGKKKELLTRQKGTNNAQFSSTFDYFVNNYSTINSPATYTVHDRNGKALRVIEDNAQVAELKEIYHTQPMEFFDFKTSEDVKLNGWMLKPANFDKNKKYPVFMYLYGGPGSQQVTDSWKGQNYWWFQMLAQQGYIVACVDNRGTGGRGEEFKKQTYLNLGKLETIDQIEAAKYLGSLPYADANRVGIFGWSYGGYMSSKHAKSYRTFLDFSHNFFSKKMLRSTPSGPNWRVIAPRFQLIWQKQQPLIHFESLDLVAVERKDSINIENTSGDFFPLKTEWQGSGGKVLWNRLDEKTPAYALLNDYQIDMTSGHYTAKNVQFFYEKYFGQQSIIGTLNDCVANNSHSPKSSYPKFAASDNQLNIHNLAKGLSYQGGFALYGLTVLGVGIDQPAILEQLDHQNKLLLRLSGNRFLFKAGGEIVGKTAAVAIYFDQDSIYHPGINVKYTPEEQLILYSEEKNITKSPFYDSYHQLFIYTDQIDWLPKEQAILISPTRQELSGKGRIKIESKDYFDGDFFYRIQNIANYHPLVLIKMLSEKEGSSQLSAEVLAKKINPNFSESNIKSLLFELEQYGFIQYHPDQHLVQVKEKVFQYADASIQKIDFDVLKIVSEYDQTNGRIDLNTKVLTLEGVKHVPLHIRQKVGIQPTKEHIQVGKNRQTSYDGKTFAGHSTFAGKAMVFDYEKYQIDMDSVQYFDLFLKDSATASSKPKAVGITSRIENTAGILLVNAPQNKSGKEVIATFPSFQSSRSAYVYYDLANQQGDCYTKDDFYFELEKFSFNSLSDFDEKDLHFKGKMVSAGIFPDFQETLVYQPHDRSLGFVTATPQKGLSSYQQKGNFKGTIQLSNRGFEGKGELEYGATILQSEDIIFKPAQATCTADSFHLREDASRSIPEAFGEEVTIDWLPQQDSMFITSQKKSFQLFKDGEHQIGGMLIYTPEGLKGKGIFEWSQGEMTSNLFSFGNFSIMTEKTDLKINTLQTDGVAFDTRDLNGNIDFEQKKGRFKANNATSVTTMPYNQYITTLNEFEWDLGKKAMTLVADKGKKGVFISTHPAQDSLQYEGSSARYDFETSEMKIEEVSFILAADALIYPENGQIKIESDGFIKTLNHAKIVADYQNQYHDIHNATVKIKGRKDFSAQGDYDYDVAGKKQIIHFANITGSRVGKGKKSEKATATIGITTIPIENQFYLDAKTRFQGEISFRSSEKNLNFDGFAQLDVPILKNQQWFRTQFAGDKNNMLIKNETPQSEDGQDLHTGLYIGRETQQTYSSVLMPLQFRKDRAFFEASGVFQYRPKTDEFVFGDSMRLVSPTAKGNQMVFSRQKAKLNATGQFEICPNIRGAKLDVFGQVKTGFRAAQLTDPTLVKDDVQTEWVAAFDLGLPKPLQKVLSNDLLKTNMDAPALIYQNPEVYTTALAHLMPESAKADRAISKYQQEGIFQPIFGKDAPMFLLADLKMEWQPIHQSFVLRRHEVGISAILGQTFQKRLKGLLEFHQPANDDDRFYFYVESHAGYFYYFNYKKGILHLCSNNPDFKTAFDKLNKADKIKAIGQGETYELQWTTEDLVGHFKQRMEWE